MPDTKPDDTSEARQYLAGALDAVTVRDECDEGAVYALIGLAHAVLAAGAQVAAMRREVAGVRTMLGARQPAREPVDF